MMEPLEQRVMLSGVKTPALVSADLSGVKSFVYQLQNVDLVAMGATKFDLAVIDYSADGSDALRYSARQVRHLRNSPGGKKVMLSYMSIGEAEDYRWYWSSKWDKNHDGTPDKGAPSWLGPQDPDWPGNYKVKYWDAGWQGIVKRYLDKAIDASFDGVYLDIIDAYEYWGPGGDGHLNRATAEQEMVDFVKTLAVYARETRGAHRFVIYVQNAEELVAHKDYVRAVNGIGREDTWYDGNVANRPADVSFTLGNLDQWKAAGKSVLCIDYVIKPALIDDFYGKATARGFVPYASVRDLDVLTINPGHEPV